MRMSLPRGTLGWGTHLPGMGYPPARSGQGGTPPRDRIATYLHSPLIEGPFYFYAFSLDY